MSVEQADRVPEGATVYELSEELVALLAQPEMQALRGLLSDKGAKQLVNWLGAMSRDELMRLRAKLFPPASIQSPDHPSD